MHTRNDKVSIDDIYQNKMENKNAQLSLITNARTAQTEDNSQEQTCVLHTSLCPFYTPILLTLARNWGEGSPPDSFSWLHATFLR